MPPLTLAPYRARKLVNRYKHVDSWFWNRYSAHPYIGCRSGCDFCYFRGGTYLGKRDVETFDTLVQVKENAAELLRAELPRHVPDMIFAGDWQQPAEDRTGLSRRMLEVVLSAGWPLLVVERSPLLARDIDLLQAIEGRAGVRVLISFSNVDPDLKRVFEPRSPGIGRRLALMRRLADAGVPVGASLMPVIPMLGDSVRLLDEAVRAFRDHGARYLIGGGLTMEGAQAERTLKAATAMAPSLAARWRAFYSWPEAGKPAYGPTRRYQLGLAQRIRDICTRHGLPDRMPRIIGSGPLARNRALVAHLFDRLHARQLDAAAESVLWQYRKAAWAVDDLDTLLESADALAEWPLAQADAQAWLARNA